MSKIVFYLFCTVLCCTMVVGTSMALAQQHIKFKHLGINDGLSQNSVFCILQDHNGLIWIGTDDGLNKYDGYEFTIYKHQINDKNSLSHSQVNTLLEDRKHNLWIGTPGGVNVFNPRTQKFTHLKTSHQKTGESENYISALLEDERGNIWIGTYDGLKLYDGKTVSHFYPSDKYMANNNLNKVKALFEDRDHLLWVSVGNDLKRFDPVTHKYLPLPAALETNLALRRNNVRSIKQDKQGVLWFGSETGGVYKFDRRNNTCINLKQGSAGDNKLPANVVRDILIDNDRIWIGTRNGLNIYNNTTGQLSEYQHNRFDPLSLSHNSVRSFMKDKNGNIWLGTFAGGINIYNLSSENFTNISEQVGNNPGLNHSVVSSILHNSNGSLWVGTEGGGLNYIDSKKNIYKYYSVQKAGNNAQSNIVKSLAQDIDGSLWIGTYDGPVHFNVTTGATQLLSLNKEREDQDKRQEVTSLLCEPNGVWVASNGSGLYYINRSGQITSYLRKTPAQSLTSDNLTALRKGENGNLWVGSLRGLNYFDRRHNIFKQFLNNPDNNRSLSNNSVLSLFTDAKQHLWIGTSGGLNYYDAKTGNFYAITENEGLANNVIHAIQQANDGSLWVSSNHGLANIKFKQFKVPFNKADISVFNYTLDDGLQSNQFSPRAVAKASNGELFFGGINGISSFYPERLINNRNKPNVVFTAFEIKNKPVVPLLDESPLTEPINDTKKITLTYDQAFISIKFAALNYLNSNKNQYAYKLEGLRNDNDWHYVGNQRTAAYTSLNEGTYTFKVKASNNDGVWNDIPRTLQITVLPPPWKTWWAYLFYSAVLLSLLYFFYYHSYQTATLKHKLDIEHALHEKDEELAQRKLSFFTNISHEIKTPLTLILAPIDRLLNMNEGNNKVQNQLMLMQRNGNRLIRLINQLLDFRKFESGNMKLHATEGNIVKFAKEIITAFDAYGIEKKVSLKFNPQSRQISAWFDRDKMEKILYNLLSNAIKFTPANGKVTLSLSKQIINGKDSICMEVEDNGVGISEQHQSHLFEQFSHHPDHIMNAEGSGIGLAFTKGLVELHHGQITFKSTPTGTDGTGYTCFTITLPAGNLHLQPDEMGDDVKDIELLSNYDFETELPVIAHGNDDHAMQDLINAELKEKPVMLIVEDNKELQSFIAESFETNFQIHKAADGQIGWDMAVELIPDIIISDVMMPNMSGTILCSKLKTDARTSHIPIILLTARTSLIYKIEGLETGADDYITKPFSLQLLEKRINNLLDLRRKLRERYSREIHLQPTNTAITSPDEKFLEKVMKFIEQNMEESNLSVEEMGKEVGMSRVTLYRKIKALTDQSAIEFIRSVRLKRAAQLLEQNKFHISEVAYMVGFTDLDYFRRCFKQQFGQNPKDYSKCKQVN
jgi:ligand-binding sensor domain-containing protein/signal transduction histidine kinase/DNA-binding response OmpR family regulator